MSEENAPICYVVPEEWEGKRLDVFLASKEESLSRSSIQKLIERNLVEINKANPKASHLLKAGEQVYLTQPPAMPFFPLAEESEAISVVYEDEYLIVVNKPANMAVHPMDEEGTGTLVQAMLFHSIAIAEAVYDINSLISRLRPGIVHRLDKNTTGLIVIAKTKEVLQKLSNQFKNHEVRKEYIAIVNGRVPDATTIHTNIGRKISRKNMMGVRTNSEQGREAITHLTPLAYYFWPPTGSEITLLKCQIETGRTHQIRVHCKFAGHAILGDVLYTNKPTLQLSQSLGVHRQLLHASVLEFTHPISGKLCSFKSELPEDMQAVLTKLQSPDSVKTEGL